MGKVVGENFNDFVKNQINIRQKKLGITEYDDDLLTFTTSKDSYIRLSSAVDISQEKLATLNISPLLKFPKGNSLAESYVLFGGANNVTKSSKPKGGLINTYTDSILANASYGFDSSKEYGLVPLPGVTSFNIKPKNNGSIVEGEIKIKCYNIQQFNHIESLYLRLGYTLLLEWGHTVYFNNKGTLETQLTDNTDTVLKSFLGMPIEKIIGERKLVGPQPQNYTPSPDPQTTILNLIKEARKKSSGNYDAIIGRVKNYEWTVTPTGEYEISISVLSPGSIVESLSISTVLPNKKLKNKDASAVEPIDPIESTSIGKILSSFRKVLSEDRSALGRLYNFVIGNGANPISELGELIEVRKTNPIKYQYFYTTEALTNSTIADLTGLEVTPFLSPPDQSSIPKREILRIDPSDLEPKEEEGTSSSLYYIKFGALLRIIQNFLLLYNTSQKNAPIVAIDYSYDDNKCFLPSENIFSSDPRVCIIPSRFSGTRQKKGFMKTPFNLDIFNEALGTDFQNVDTYSYNFMHIFLSIDNLYSILKNNINSSGDLALIDFLTAICTGINTSLSNTTEFSPFLDTDTNILHIVNKRNSSPIIEDQEPPSKFQIGFLHNNGKQGLIGIENGSFVKDVSIKSTIPPNFATQISIGAQANKTTTEPNAFSNWNVGYTDRIFLDKQSSGSPKTKAEETEEENIEEKFENTTSNTIEAAYLYSRFDFNEDLFKLSTDVTQFFKIETSKSIQKDEKLTAPLMIPISLSLTLDGLSGMKIFQKYTITDDFLPQSYRDNIEFVIKGISHTIDSNGWITNLEGQFMPKSKNK
jgi:hypothetical protein